MKSSRRITATRKAPPASKHKAHDHPEGCCAHGPASSGAKAIELGKSLAELGSKAPARSSSPASSMASQALASLKDQGARLTTLRKKLVELIAAARGPLSVGDLRSALSVFKLNPNKSTLYRELYFLMEQRIVVEVDFLDGMKRYEFMAHDGHHHHMICTCCKSVECVEVCFDTSALLLELGRRSKFKVQSHVLEFFGLCEQCQ